MSIYTDPVLVTLSLSDPLVTLQTYDPKHGWTQRFYLTKETLCRQLCDNAEGSITETDILNVCTVTNINNSIRFTMLWLQGNYSDDVHGYRQMFYIPVEKVASVLAGNIVKYLAYTPVFRDKAKLILTETAHRVIAEADKLQRHAIRRCFRDNFSYGKSECLVIQRDEFVHGFYFFSTVSRYEGGIVQHETEVKGKDGKLHRKVYFGIHT